ncbi:MAG: hypothetical protein K9I71_03675 [Ignavibacteriales bacterium]|nr:hypothetical protein [Ignavibacteriales bacterium]MCF8315194.1 hypothetical protein [Ignavibacteriales bacterium]MCF8438469.1 hypothetical protein [Ignavibacteriales bacterium]
MVIDLVIKSTGDGYTSNVPSLKGCESWAHTEDEVMSKTLDLVSFFLSVEVDKIIVDRARRSGNSIIYKLIFDKN